MCLVFLDQLSKMGIAYLQRIESIPFISFGNIANQGFMLGGLANLTPVLRIVCASTLLGFIFFVFVLIQYLLIPKVISLRLGLSFIVGGITGNVIDRAFLGYVRDFITIIQGIYFNVADIFLGAGVLLAIYSLFAFKDILWRRDCLRKGILIQPKLQIAFSLKLTLITFAFSIVLSAFSISFFKSLGIPSTQLIIYSVSLIALSGVFLITTFIAGIFLSHRSVGPLYAFEKFIEGLVEGTNKAPFRLREGDNYKHLEIIAEKIRVRLK